MGSSTDVSNIYTVITSFGDIVEKCCTESAATFNVMCEIRPCGMCTYIYRYMCKRPKLPPGFLFCHK